MSLGAGLSLVKTLVIGLEVLSAIALQDVHCTLGKKCLISSHCICKQMVAPAIGLKTIAKIKERYDDGNSGPFFMAFSPSEKALEGFRALQIEHFLRVRKDGAFPGIAQKYLWVLCQENDLDYAILLALIEMESGFSHTARSSTGCLGLMQISFSSNKKLIRELGYSDLQNPYQNLHIGCVKLGRLLRRYGGNYGKALTAYNLGEGGAMSLFRRGEINGYAKHILVRAKVIRKILFQAG